MVEKETCICDVDASELGTTIADLVEYLFLLDLSYCVAFGLVAGLELLVVIPCFY